MHVFKQLPEVHFIYAYPLDVEMRQRFESKNDSYPSQQEVKETLERWIMIWQEQNRQNSILKKLSEVTGRVPERNLECFVFGYGLIPKSTPFMLPIWNRNRHQWSDEKFIDLMIHELLHIFLATNNDAYWKFVRENYKNEPPITQNHILLYALLYVLYENIWQIEPLDFHRGTVPPAYARAIEIVKEEGPQRIIETYSAYR